MIIRLWHNRRVTGMPIDDETGEPLYGPILGVTPGDDLMEVHSIPDWPDEPMPETPLEAATILNKVHEALGDENISVGIGDVVQIKDRFWGCEAIDPLKHHYKWSGLPLTVRMLMYWTKLEHSRQAPCSCPECLELAAGNK